MSKPVPIKPEWLDQLYNMGLSEGALLGREEALKWVLSIIEQREICIRSFYMDWLPETADIKLEELTILKNTIKRGGE